MIMLALQKSVIKTARPRILIVDDDPSVLSGMNLVLKQDYDIIEAQSIAQGLNAYERQPPDLITLDIRMPEVDGMEGLDIFRHRSKKIPIILISGYHTFELAQQALRLGATDYLTKPFEAEELRQTIKTALTKVRYDKDPDFDSTCSDANFMVRLSLQNLKEDKFLSLQHRNHFLTFAQNVLSNKKRAFEVISVNELIKTMDLQFKALCLSEKAACEIVHSNHKVRIECDMYLLGEMLANLALTCVMESRNDKSPVRLIFDYSKNRLRVCFKKSGLQLPEDVRVRFEQWHQYRNTDLDTDTAMLALVEKVVELHQGQFITNGASDSLLEIVLPLHLLTEKTNPI